MADLVIRIDQAALTALGTRPGSPIYKYMLETLARVDARAKQYMSGEMVRVRTGNLRSSQSFRIEVIGTRITGVVENHASYALALHEGTRPHEIRPRNGKVLTGWSFRGQPVFTPVVHHPGTAPRPFLLQALRDVIGGGAMQGITIPGVA